MPTKAEQARINGAKSKGPTTPEGLQRCREASVKHGMWAAHVSTFPHEDQVQYAAIFTSLNDQFRPRNTAEAAIVGLLADAIWRANRLANLANAGIDREMWLLKNQTSVQHSPGELQLLAEQASKTVPGLEARARHYTREINRLVDIIRKFQSFPVPEEASEVMNEIMDLAVKEVPAPSQTATPEPPPGQKPVQRDSNKPQEGSVPRRK